jgi:hypothetical protein
MLQHNWHIIDVYFLLPDNLLVVIYPKVGDEQFLRHLEHLISLSLDLLVHLHVIFYFLCSTTDKLVSLVSLLGEAVLRSFESVI